MAVYRWTRFKTELKSVCLFGDFLDSVKKSKLHDFIDDRRVCLYSGSETSSLKRPVVHIVSLHLSAFLYQTWGFNFFSH